MRALLATLSLLLVTCIARADTITFGTQDVDLLVSAGTQTEGMFSYTATSGTGWEIQSTYGNPPSGLATFFNAETSAVGDTVDFTLTGGGFFTFGSVDSAAVTTDADIVTITGFLGAAPVGSLVLASPSTSFQTFNSTFSGAIDLLRVQVTTFGGQSARVLDNFVLTAASAPTAVPESFPMVCTAFVWAGLLCVGVLSRRRKAAAIG